MFHYQGLLGPLTSCNLLHLHGMVRAVMNQALQAKGKTIEITGRIRSKITTGSIVW